MRFSHVVILAFIALCAIGFYIFFVPVNVIQETKVEIPYGASVALSGSLLKDAGIIHSEEGYVLLTKILSPNGVIAGRYAFSGKISTMGVVIQVGHGLFGTKQVRITIPEGFTNQEIINRIAANFPTLNKTEIKAALPKLDGYIYPETYFFDPDATVDQITTKIIDTGNKKISAILDPINISSPEAKRILTIASLIEAEGKTQKERQVIAGIIENRLAIGMPLQLDATLTYLTGKGSSQLTQSDLKIDSPYNTYVYKGLPPGPINNPGEESIRAAMDPTESKYLFYLHGKDGQIYYAVTYAEHLRNKNNYLK